MSQIQSGLTADLLTVGVTSKAAFVEQVQANGDKVFPVLDNSFVARVDVAPSAVTAGLSIWSIFNTGVKSMYLTAADLTGLFAGTAAATRSLFDLVRISAAAPTGGTAIQSIRKNTAKPNPSGVDIRFAPAGLTTTGVNFESDPLDLFPVINQLTASTVMARDWSKAPIILAPNQGLAIRTNGAVVVGAGLQGSVQWDER